MVNLQFIFLTLTRVFIIAVVFLSFYGCQKIYVDEENCDTYDYAECNTIEPKLADLEVSVSINPLNTKIPITVYIGYYDNKVKLFTDTLKQTSKIYRLPVSNYYSVLAKYNTPNGIIYALDGGKLDKQKQNVCDSTCWWEKGRQINLRLKNSEGV